MLSQAEVSRAQELIAEVTPRAKAAVATIKAKTKTALASQAEVVTSADLSLDEWLIAELKQRFPNHGVLTEESELVSEQTGMWVVDPLDGSTNAAHGLPLYGVALSYWEAFEPRWGALVLPAFNEVMTGGPGFGVQFNGQPHTLPPFESPSPLVTVAPVLKPAEHGRLVELVGAATKAPRDYGCSVYQSMLLAQGKCDAYVAINLGLWDFGALLPLAQVLGLEYEWLSSSPTSSHRYLGGYEYSVVVGRKALVSSLIKALHQDFART